MERLADNAIQSQTSRRAEGDRAVLLQWLARKAYQYRPNAPFSLASGGTSPEYLDCRQALSHPEALDAAARLMSSHLSADVEAVGGLTMGADPLAVATSQAAERAQPGRDLRWFSVRKAPKGHGRGRLVEGDVPPGTRVAVIDDVATTGGSTREAVEKCRAEGLDVVQVLVLVDREQGGMSLLRSLVREETPVGAIVTKTDIRAVWDLVAVHARADAGGGQDSHGP